MTKNKQSRKRCTGVGWFLCLCVACSALWNCARTDPDPVEEITMASRAFISDDEIDIEVVWKNYNQDVAATLTALRNSEIGRKLLKEVKSTGITITLEILVDNNGDVVWEQEWGYKGNGVIGYGMTTLVLPNLDEFMFHELFHVVQTGRSTLRMSLNNEVEAYLAQFLYAESKQGSGTSTIPGIGTMASYFDWETREFKFNNDNDRENFDNAYWEAMAYLMNSSQYAGYEWSAVQSFNTLYSHPLRISLFIVIQ